MRTTNAAIAIALVVMEAGSACAAPSADEGALGVSRSALLEGRVSGAEENATVFVETGPDAADTLRCSGTLVAPNLVLTARHCLLQRRGIIIDCKADGTPGDGATPTTEQDLRPEEPANIAARYGATVTDFVSVKAKAVLAPPEVSLCRSDLAFVVLEGPLAQEHAAIRMAVPKLGEPFRLTGWGRLSDAPEDFPLERRSRDGLRVSEVGPGLIPAGNFATDGPAACFGDSGGGAWFGSAVAGVFSSVAIGVACASAANRNYFALLAPHRSLIESAFAAAGQKPWYAGEPRPWLSADGAACMAPADCQSELCNAHVCGPPVPPAADTPAAAPADPGCSFAPRRARTPGAWLAASALALGALVRGRRGARRVTR